MNTGLEPDLVWNAASGATHYRWQMYQGANLIGTGTTAGAISVSHPEELNAGTTYNWRVQGYTSAQTGAWSEVWYFTTRPPLLAPVPISPADGAVATSTNITLQWQTIAYATGYDYEFLQNGATVASGSGQPGIAIQLPGKGYYQWHVRGHTSLENGPWSPILNFNTGVLSELPGLFDYVCISMDSVAPPSASVPITASFVDGRGNPVSTIGLHFTWTFVSGPAPVTFQNPNALNTTVICTQPGNYVLTLQASGNGLTASNQASIILNPCTPISVPTTFSVDAGNSANGSTTTGVPLSGTVSLNGTSVGAPTVSMTWSKNSGPGTVIFDNSTSAATTARFSQAGVYSLKFTATETGDQHLSASDTVNITITNPPPATCALAVNAGSDIVINSSSVSSLCANLSGAVILNNVLNPASGVSITWSGPAGVSFDNSQSLRTKACFPANGTYTLTLCATACGTTTCDQVNVTFSECVGKVNAGADQTLYLNDVPFGQTPSVCTTVSGSVSQATGAAIRWSAVSGPGGVSFGNPTATTTSACFSQAGTYGLRLTAVTGTCSNWDDVLVTVNYAAEHYLTLQYKIDSFCFCGQGVTIKNTDAASTIQFVYQSTPCAGEFEPTVSATLLPGESVYTCAGEVLKIISASFVNPAPSDTTVNLNISTDWLELPALSNSRLSAGIMEFLLHGTASQNYWIMASDDLVNWSVIAAPIGTAEPVWVVDEEAGMHSQRYYRAVRR